MQSGDKKVIMDGENRTVYCMRIEHSIYRGDSYSKCLAFKTGWKSIPCAGTFVCYGGW